MTMTPASLLAALLLVTLFVAAVTLAWRKNARQVAYWRNGTPDGEHVAEVWLEWPICTGSTMFRAAFPTAADAEAAARYHAKLLDSYLPTHYPATYSCGKRYFESYDYGIAWGVRARKGVELTEGVACIFSRKLPGTDGATSEHREAHPGTADLNGSLLGFKL